MVKSFLHLLRYCRPYRRLYLLGTLALLMVDLFDTFSPKLIQWAVDHLSASMKGEIPLNPLIRLLPEGWMGPGTYVEGLWAYGVLFTLAVGITGFFRYFMSISYSRATINLIHDLRGRFFAHLQRLDASYHDRTKVGDHMSRATNDTDACRFFFGIGLLIFLDTLLYFILVPAYMLTISWKLMLASMATLPLIPLIVKKLTATVESRFERVQEQFSVLSERSRESFSGAKVVKTFAREEAEVRSFARLSREYFRRGLSYARVAALQMPSIFLLLGLADLVVVAYGGSLVLAGEITIGEFVAFFQYLVRLSGPMIGLGWMLMLFQRARVSMGRIEEILEVEPAITEAPEPAPVTDLAGDVEMRGLTFRFSEESPTVLEGIDLRVPAGRTLGIMGPVGSGKSALLQLIPRLYDPPEGTVFVDGHDVRTLPLSVLRTRIGAVPQETFLFGETVRANIALGVPGEPEPGAVEASARLARIAEDVEKLPDRYETLLGEKGVNLSGGQKQRVAIARALIRDPAILLLDDCLSSVDTHTESAILRNLREVTRNRTTLIVSHRVSTVMEADEIIVLRDGRIAERGTHAELVALGGYYADLYRKQQVEGTLPG